MNALRWLVDGMNLVGTRPDGWWRDREGAVRRVVGRLAAWQAASGVAVTAVFDGDVPAGGIERRGLVVVFAGRSRDAADDEIVRRVEADESPASLCVVTADARLARRVRRLGATVESPLAFLRRLGDDRGSVR